MQNRENGDSRRPNDIKDEVRKPRHYCAPDVAVNNWICFREVAYRFKALPHGGQELLPESRAL